MAKKKTRDGSDGLVGGQGSEVTVYLADDHAMVREGLASLLSQDAGQFSIVGQSGDGLVVCDEVKRLQPQVLVLDITMPGLNGLDVCRDIRKRCPHTNVLILSMHSDPQFIVRAIEYGAKGYLLKESATTQLHEAVSTVAGGSHYFGPGIPDDIMEQVTASQEDPYERLTNRQRQVFQLIAEGKTNRDIAEKLDLSVKTVETHRTRLMNKLGIHDQISLVKYAIRKGVVTL
ncbi:MAG: response regulator transcription factor [Phycisphaerales bacterium]|jgi:two-component system, NarL family, response regulator NreC|nr:response regulator transcription factor [Phycisphaerales bacterium]